MRGEAKEKGICNRAKTSEGVNNKRKQYNVLVCMVIKGTNDHFTITVS